ncbi:MAG: DMT family transporter [bacterium]|nr:DMT family transporter [bacterium]
MTARKGILAILFSSLCFGFLGYFGKTGYALGYSPLKLLTVRFTLATLMLWIYAFSIGIKKYHIKREKLLILIPSGIAYALTSLGYFYALSYMPASYVSILFYIHPIITIVVATIVFREKITKEIFMAVLFAIVGTTLVSSAGAITVRNFSVVGLGWILVAATSYSIFTLLGQRTTATSDALVVTTYSVSFCALFLIILNPPLYMLDGSMTTAMWLIGLGISLISSVLAILFFVIGVRAVGATRTSIAASSEPLAGVIVAYILLGDRLALMQWVGVLLIVIAVSLLTITDTPVASFYKYIRTKALFSQKSS